MAKICVISIDPTFANGASVVNALREKTEVVAVFQKRDSKGMYKLCNADYGLENIPEVDQYIILGGGTLQRVVDKIGGKVKVVITDTRYRYATNEIDNLIEKVNAEVFCMPDLWHLCKFEKKAFYQPFNINWVKVRKLKQVTLCHSPYSDSKAKVKGTKYITKVFEYMKEKYSVDYHIIKGVSWNECLELKSYCQIFVDQFLRGEYIGGIGKSGLEAMLLKCLTISSGKLVETDIPAPPVVWCNRKLYDTIKKYTLNKKLRDETVAKQYRWAKKYTSFDFVSERLLEGFL